MTAYCVIGADKTIAARCPHVGAFVDWMPLPVAWRTLDHVLTWDTQEGAQRFADMNGGTVTLLAEVFDQSVILPSIESQPTDRSK